MSTIVSHVPSFGSHKVFCLRLQRILTTWKDPRFGTCQGNLQCNCFHIGQTRVPSHGGRQPRYIYMYIKTIWSWNFGSHYIHGSDLGYGDGEERCQYQPHSATNNQDVSLLSLTFYCYFPLSARVDINCSKIPERKRVNKSSADNPEDADVQTTRPRSRPKYLN